MLVSFRVLVFVLLAATMSQAQTHSWTGNGGDNNWFTASNWDVGTIPDQNSDVFLGINSVVEIAAAASIATITIDAGANLFLQAGLTIDGTITINNTGIFTWQDGSITGGAIVNNGFMLMETFAQKTLDNVEITNNSELVMLNANNIRLLNSVQFLNSAQALFTIASNGSISAQDTTNHLFVNEGLLQKVSNNSGNPGTCYLIFDLENRGVLKTMPNETFLILGSSFNFTNFEEGRIEGFGILDVTANFSNLGTYDPGNDVTVGTIGITNTFATSSESNIIIDIQGTEPSQYDSYDIFGFPNLEGNILVNLAMIPTINDEFTILTANEIISCDFPSQITSVNGGVVFDVICNTTSVVLRVAEILSVEDFTNKETRIANAPNPVTNQTRFYFSSEITSEENVQLNIYNFQGQLVDTVKNLVDAMIYNRNRLSSGLYFARVETDRKVIATTKMVLK